LRERSREAVVWESADQQSQFSLASGMSGMSRASRRSRFSTMSKLSRVSNPSQVGVLFESDMELPDNHFQELAAEQYELNLTSTQKSLHISKIKTATTLSSIPKMMNAICSMR